MIFPATSGKIRFRGIWVIGFPVLINCAFWQMGHIASLDRQYLENGNTVRIINRSSRKLKVWPFGWFRHFGYLLIPFPNFLSVGVCRMPASSYKAIKINGVTSSFSTCNYRTNIYLFYLLPTISQKWLLYHQMFKPEP